jgi:antitoxin FitA
MCYLLEDESMAGMTIRNLDDSIKRRLRIRAAAHGKSMEEEAREILRTALGQEKDESRSLSNRIQQRFAEEGGVDLRLPEREPLGPPPDFGR